MVFYVHTWYRTPRDPKLIFNVLFFLNSDQIVKNMLKQMPFHSPYSMCLASRPNESHVAHTAFEVLTFRIIDCLWLSMIKLHEILIVFQGIKF